MAFHDVRLPDEVEQGSSGGPNFNTTILTMASGQEQRNVNWAEARAQYDISYGIQNREDYEVCQAFFYARRGRGYGFRFKDWSDFQTEGELLGLGDGTNKAFQLIRSYETDGPMPYARKITRPVDGTLKVYIDDVVTTAFALSGTGNSIIVFNTAPGVDAVVTADYEFDVPVRFDVDSFNLALEWSEAGSIGSLPLVELRE